MFGRELSSVDVSTWRGGWWDPLTLSVSLFSFACDPKAYRGVWYCYLRGPIGIRHCITAVSVAATELDIFEF